MNNGNPPVRLPVVLRLFLGVFFAAGLVAFAFGVRDLACGLACRSWPTAEGKVTSAKLTSHHSSGRHGGTSYSAQVVCTYLVAGQPYAGTRLAFGQMSASAGYAHGVLARYPVGGKVTVHYSPADPGQAVLETGIHGGVWICCGVGTLFMLFSLMVRQLGTRKAAR